MSKTHYTRLLKAKERLREFNFRKLPVASGGLFHVDVSDDRGNRVVFKMQKEGNGPWKIVGDDLPLWIYESEEKLSHAIEDQTTAEPPGYS